MEFEHTNEATAQSQYEDEVAEREEDNRRLTREVNLTQGEIESTERRIADKENFLVLKNTDLENFSAELEAEHAAFEEATEFYEDVRSELVREQAVGNDALVIIQNAGFGGNVNNNIGF